MASDLHALCFSLTKDHVKQNAAFYKRHKLSTLNINARQRVNRQHSKRRISAPASGCSSDSLTAPASHLTDRGPSTFGLPKLISLDPSLGNSFRFGFFSLHVNLCLNVRSKTTSSRHLASSICCKRLKKSQPGQLTLPTAPVACRHPLIHPCPAHAQGDSTSCSTWFKYGTLY